ncbi:ubiquinone biosynthesis O-methyltransferase, mitochondrial isoform X1 [Ixodes scapularis]|uniref:ubiquinone biosynthesis O-methyltransferase, mitochondrial isoform X1 n=2 Tax=Ixodes scapularis TaxID=6945 RepID=UPI001A9FD25E|nr:ubiquinone biosynthesis O-methyltransferase, mitochondrial isoform X1 [Ixodes scapularis]
MQETWSLATNPDLGTALFLYSSHASPKTPTTTTFQSTVFEENRRKFDALNHQWWDPEGELFPLSRMNAIRVPLIRDGLLQAGRRAEKAPKSVSKPLAGLRILDVGCGGGLLSEPLARLGATVTGIDPTPGCIEVARAHADGDLEIRDSVVYEAVEAEELVRRCVKFDAVVASEVVDHVQNYRDFVKCCVALTEDGGSLFFTTINRTLLSYLIVKIAAEYIFRIVPAGLHDWNMFVPPEELEEVLETNGCHVRLIHGSFFNPLTQTWSWLKSTDLTYALHAVKSPV